MSRTDGHDDGRAVRRDGQEVLDDLAGPFEAMPGVDRSAMFGSQALRVGGKVFAFVGTEGELIVKVPGWRAGELVESGAAERVQIGRNPAREWVGVALGRTDLWSEVLKEAYQHVR